MSEEELEDLKWQQTEYEEDIISELVKENKQLKSQLQQKENIIKEVREFIEDRQEDINNGGNEHEYRVNKHILEILDKEKKDIELDMLKALNTDLDDDIEMG